MKQVNTRRILPIAVVVATIGLTSALPSAAQNTTGDMNTRAVTTQDRGFDWGWLGLLGLAGLAGLRRKTGSDSYSATTATR